MVASITHAKVSTKTDVSDTDLVRPSDWNAEHVISGLTTAEFASANISQWTNDSGYLTTVNLTTNVTGILPVANGGTGTSTQMTLGSILFAGASGVYTQDNANLFWDDTNNRLGIGTTSPSKMLHLYAGSSGVSPSSEAKLVIESSSSQAIQFVVPNNSYSGVWFGTPANNILGGIYCSGTTYSGALPANAMGFITGANLVATGYTGVSGK